MHSGHPPTLTPDEVRKIVIGVLVAMLLAALDQNRSEEHTSELQSL